MRGWTPVRVVIKFWTCAFSMMIGPMMGLGLSVGLDVGRAVGEAVGKGDGGFGVGADVMTMPSSRRCCGLRG